MTEFILHAATSLDGYIARLDGSIDWLPSPEEDGDENSYARFYSSIDALVMGSTTYEQILGFGDWPYPGKLSYILTHRNFATERADVSFVGGGVEEVVEKEKGKGDRRVWIVGGGTVASSFINRGWVDEYLIAVVPIILGSGIPLYSSLRELKLDLIELKSDGSGLVLLRYREKLG